MARSKLGKGAGMPGFLGVPGLNATTARRFVRENKRLSVFLVLIAITAIRTTSLPAKDADSRSRKSKQVELPPDEELENGVVVLSVPHRQGYKKIRIRLTPDSVFDKHEPMFLGSRKTHFMDEIRALGSIMVPRWRSRTVLLLGAHMTLLVFRTYLSLVVAKLDGRIVRHLIAAEGYEFTRGIAEWLAIAVPASGTNAMIQYLEKRISLEFRNKLVRYVHDLYLAQGMEYYKLTNIDGMDAADHYITSDLVRFCAAAAKLYSNLGKPTLDLVFFAYQLSHNLGSMALAGIFINYGITAALLKAVAPPFGKLAAYENKLEGDYRNLHARLIANAEEIAFYEGSAIEKSALQESLARLANHVMRVFRVKAAYSIMEGYVLKYSWSASGFLFASIPVFMPTWTGHTGQPAQSERRRMGEYIVNKRLMLSLADAGGRMMYSIKDVAELAGYTRRVYELIRALHRVRANDYGPDSPSTLATTPTEEYSIIDVKGELDVSPSNTGFELDQMPVVVPGLGRDLSGGELILRPITVKVNEKEHLLITGANGTGKTSIARIAAGLWPIYRGALRRHPSFAFLPQRPYFSNGTLRDQVIYPHSHFDMINAGRTDEEVHRILERVNLAYLPEREGGLGIAKEWKDVFSGGEKQRMLFARLLYARPKYAMIDEGTSAVSQDMEGLLYDELKKDGITLVTISHRLALLKYHDSKLEVGLGPDGMDSHFERLDSNQGRKSVAKEIEDIRDFLAKVPQMEARRDEIRKQLKLNV